MKEFGGDVLFIDRSDVNTDEIIPAKYLTEVSKEALGPHMLEDLKLDGFNHTSERVKCASVLVAKSNFGCGSSREHAPWSFEVNGITLILASSFARIFRQNMFNCGMMALELPADTIEQLFAFDNGRISCDVNLDTKTIVFKNGQEALSIDFSIRDFDEALVRAGGWVEYADTRY